MLLKLKKFLSSTPIHINGKPVAAWKLLLNISLIILIPLISYMVSRANRPPTPDELIQKTYQKAKQAAVELSSKISTQTQVPQNETPNVATITDVSLLQDQEFFKQAKNGDKLLIYEKKKIIVLYRPGEDKVIATAPVLFNTNKDLDVSTSSANFATSSAKVLNN